MKITITPSAAANVQLVLDALEEGSAVSSGPQQVLVDGDAAEVEFLSGEPLP